MTLEKVGNLYEKVLLEALRSPTARVLPETEESPVCGICRGAGFVSGAWKESEGLDAKATSRGQSKERPYRACPACTQVKLRGPSVEDACREIGDMGEAVHALQALSRDERWCVFMRGSVGIGKTYLATAWANSFRLEGRAVCNVVCCDLLDRLRETQDPQSEEKLSPVLDLYSDVDVLVLDDLGAERTTEWALEQLFKIIDRRYTHQRTTIITSNIRVMDIESKLGQRIFSRLKSSQVVVAGKDRR